MSRLTKRHGKHAVQIGAETRRHDEAWLKLAHYEDLEEQGGLIELPCKVGDDVWIIPSKVNYELNVLSKMEKNNKVHHQKIDTITVTKDGWYVVCDKEKEFGTGRVEVDKLFGETWFLTKEEAEAKLKELREGAE